MSEILAGSIPFFVSVQQNTSYAKYGAFKGQPKPEKFVSSFYYGEQGHIILIMYLKFKIKTNI